MNESTNIEKEKRDSGFSVPSNYFEELEKNVQNRISSKPKQIGDSSIRYKYILSGIAAGIVGILIWLTLPATVDSTAPPELDYTSFVLENADEFGDELIFETYIEVSQKKHSVNEEEDVYIEYIINEDIDENTLIEEL